MLDRLMASGTWMSRHALAQGASTSMLAIDDALADLVLEKKAEYRQSVGYRLAGSELTRAAAKTLREKGLIRAVCGRQVKGEYCVGVAEQHQAIGLVMYEMTMPMPAPGPMFLAQHLVQVQQVVEFSKRGL